MFSSWSSILVNGSPTRDFKCSKGLCQGDPLAPFLFLVVAEGLSGLMREASAKGYYKDYKVGNGSYAVSLLQYADDTIFFGDVDQRNVFTIKTILRFFELVPGLKVNFHKSNFGDSLRITV